MRVLNVLDNLSLDSGVSAVVMNIYKNFSSDIQVDFFVCRKNEDPNKSYYDEVISLGGNVFYCENPLAVSSLASAVKNAKRFFKKHAKEYDVVHLHAPTISPFSLRYAKRYGAKCRIIHSHSSMTSPNKIKAFINKLLMRGKKYANVYWACSDKAAEFLYGTKENIEIIKNVTDSSIMFFDSRLRDSVRSELNLDNKKVITHISNFSPIKNHFFLLDVISEVVKKDEGFVFLFVGDGPAKNAFEAEIKNLGLEKNVIFTGRQGDVRKYLCAADLLLLPSLKEGLPVVVVEAQACGLPCLVSDTVTRECNVGNVSFLQLAKEEWINKISGLMPSSAEERRHASDEFKKCDYDAAKEAKRVEKLYEALICGEMQKNQD